MVFSRGNNSVRTPNAKPTPRHNERNIQDVVWPMKAYTPLLMIVTMFKKNNHYQQKVAKLTVKRIGPDGKQKKDLGEMIFDLAEFCQQGKHQYQIEKQLKGANDEKSIIKVQLTSKSLELRRDSICSVDLEDINENKQNEQTTMYGGLSPELSYQGSLSSMRDRANSDSQSERQQDIIKDFTQKLLVIKNTCIFFTNLFPPFLTHSHLSLTHTHSLSLIVRLKSRLRTRMTLNLLNSPLI